MTWTLRVRLAWSMLCWIFGSGGFEWTDEELTEIVREDDRIDYAHLTLADGTTVEKRDGGELIVTPSTYHDRGETDGQEA